MSKTAYGIPINMGLTHGVRSDKTWSPLTNALPYKFTMLWNKPLNLKTLADRDMMEMVYFIQGRRVKILDSDPIVKGLQSSHYFWTGQSWYDMKIPVVENYLNIYQILSTDEQLENEPFPRLTFFMTCNISNIQANISLLSMINNVFIIRNNEFATFASLDGNYNLNAEATTSIIPHLININLHYSVENYLNGLCTKYGVSPLNFITYVNKLKETLTEVIRKTYYDFYMIFNSYPNIDISMYVHYIASCFASFDAIYKNQYNSIHRDISMIDPLPKLSMLDGNLKDRLNLTAALGTKFAKILQTVDEIIYNQTDPNQYYPQFSTLINYFINNGTGLKRIGDINKFLTEICEGIGGLINLALLFALMSSVDKGTKTSLFFNFLVPGKYSNIN